jgi:hypothetical protein
MLIGYTKSYRAKWENPVFRNLLEAGIWSWMCDTAVWQETRVRFNGKLVILQRGQLITSLRFISKGFCVSEQVIRTLLNHLLTDGMINTQLTHAGTVITICNYEKYQSSEDTANTPTNTALTQHQHSTNTNNKEDKKIRKEIRCLEGKTDFQKIYETASELFPKLATANTYEINKWLENDCSVELDILPEIKRKEGQNIGSWSYFTEPIARAKANRLKPMPEVAATQGGGYQKELSVSEHNRIVMERVKQKLLAEGKLT